MAWDSLPTQCQCRYENDFAQRAVNTPTASTYSRFEYRGRYSSEAGQYNGASCRPHDVNFHLKDQASNGKEPAELPCRSRVHSRDYGNCLGVREHRPHYRESDRGPLGRDDGLGHIFVNPGKHSQDFRGRGIDVHQPAGSRRK